jgi:hypothetical protein
MLENDQDADPMELRKDRIGRLFIFDVRAGYGAPNEKLSAAVASAIDDAVERLEGAVRQVRLVWAAAAGGKIAAELCEEIYEDGHLDCKEEIAPLLAKAYDELWGVHSFLHRLSPLLGQIEMKPVNPEAVALDEREPIPEDHAPAVSPPDPAMRKRMRDILREQLEALEAEEAAATYGSNGQSEARQ